MDNHAPIGTPRNAHNWFIVDGHVDLAYNALGWRRNYRRAARWTRQREEGTLAARQTGQCAVGLPDLVCGHIGLVFGTIFVEPARRTLGDSPIFYRDTEEAHDLGMAQLDFYHRWADEDPHLRVVESQQGLTDVLTTWHLQADSSGRLSPKTASNTEQTRHQVGIVPLLEGADPITEPKELERWAEHGLRIVGPAWTGTRYAGGTGEPGGLTKLGHELLEMVAELRLILDVSHLAQQALFEALEEFEGGPGFLIASHSNPQRIIQTDRHLPDRAIEMIAERRGVIGVVLFNAFLKRGWGKGSKKHEVTLDDVVRAVDHICQVTGSADYTAIGSDLDGGYGSEAMPRELDTSRDLYKVGDELLYHGYTRDDVTKIMGGNWLRILRNGLP
jgi:membrane dipeptidase